MGLQEKLDKLKQSKEAIKLAIEETGDITIEEEATFRSYPEQIQYIIDTTIIPQSELDSLVNKTNNIIGVSADSNKYECHINNDLSIDIPRFIGKEFIDSTNTVKVVVTQAKINSGTTFPASTVGITNYTTITNISNKIIDLSWVWLNGVCIGNDINSQNKQYTDIRCNYGWNIPIRLRPMQSIEVTDFNSRFFSSPISKETLEDNCYPWTYWAYGESFVGIEQCTYTEVQGPNLTPVTCNMDDEGNITLINANTNKNLLDIDFFSQPEFNMGITQVRLRNKSNNNIIKPTDFPINIEDCLLECEISVRNKTQVNYKLYDISVTMCGLYIISNEHSDFMVSYGGGATIGYDLPAGGTFINNQFSSTISSAEVTLNQFKQSWYIPTGEPSNQVSYSEVE